MVDVEQPVLQQQLLQQQQQPQHGDNLQPQLRESNVKLPDFWAADLELWFTRVESVFRRHHVVNSLTKFDCLLEKLPNEVLISIRDVIRGIDDDTDNPYGLVKERLLASFKPSPRSQINKIIDHAELGGGKPSILMSSMLALLPDGEPAGLLFEGLFLRRLPAEMREHLAARTFATPREMALHADALWEARNSAADSVAAIGRHSSPGRPKSPHRGGKKWENRGGLCFFHYKFGEKARRCEPPCTWTGNCPAASGN